MQIKEYKLDRSTISDFADANNLVMEVHERHAKDNDMRFYAHFSNSETKDGICLCGTFGNGRTKEDAIAEYSTEISGKLLVIDAMDKGKRKEIRVPILES